MFLLGLLVLQFPLSLLLRTCLDTLQWILNFHLILYVTVNFLHLYPLFLDLNLHPFVFLSRCWDTLHLLCKWKMCKEFILNALQCLHFLVVAKTLPEQIPTSLTACNCLYPIRHEFGHQILVYFYFFPEHLAPHNQRTVLVELPDLFEVGQQQGVSFLLWGYDSDRLCYLLYQFLS